MKIHNVITGKHSKPSTLTQQMAFSHMSVLRGQALNVVAPTPPPPFRKHGRGPRSQAKTAVQRPPHA